MKRIVGIILVPHIGAALCFADDKETWDLAAELSAARDDIRDAKLKLLSDGRLNASDHLNHVGNANIYSAYGCFADRGSN